MNDKRTPEMSGQEKMGVIDDETPIGTVFEFDLVKGDIDPRTNSRREKGGEFTLRLTEKCPGSYMFSCSGCKHPVAATKEAWTERYAPAVTGVRWPEGKTVENVKRPEGKPAGTPVPPPPLRVAAEPEAAKRKASRLDAVEAEADRQLEARRDNIDPAAGPRLELIPIASIVREVDNHRGKMSEEKLAELAESIARVGLMHAVSVCKRGDKYVLISGHRRLEAVGRLKRKMIGARIWEGLTNEQIAEMQFIENLQREDLTPIEEARGIAALVKAGQSIDTVASRIDRSQEFVRGRLDLLRLAEPIQELVASGRLPLKHGRLIARVGDAAGQMNVAVCAMGGGGYPWCASEKGLAEAAKSDHVAPLQRVRESVTVQLQALGGAHWPMDAGYAGKRPCQGCIDNSATEPGLFEQIKLPGKSKTGNCSNKPCFVAKFNAWQKDPVKKQRDKERAAKAKDKAKQGGQAPAAKGGKEDDGLAAKRLAFPSTPQEQLAVALWKYGVGLGDQMLQFMKKGKKLPADALAIAVRLALSEMGGEMWVSPPEKTQAIIRALRGKGALTVDRSVMALIMADSVVERFRYSEPEWPSHSREPQNVPLNEGDLQAIEMLEALAKRWKVEIKTKRPTLAKVEAAYVAAEIAVGEAKAKAVEGTIAKGKKPAALAAIKVCTYMAMLERLDKKGLRGDWRRAAVRGRIETLKKKPSKPAKKRVKASVAAS